jgi:hypothetical protein
LYVDEVVDLMEDEGLDVLEEGLEGVAVVVGVVGEGLEIGEGKWGEDEVLEDLVEEGVCVGGEGCGLLRGLGFGFGDVFDNLF